MRRDCAVTLDTMDNIHNTMPGPWFALNKWKQLFLSPENTKVQTLIYSEKLSKYMKCKRGAWPYFLQDYDSDLSGSSRAGALDVTQFDLNGRLRQIAVMCCVFSNKVAWKQMKKKVTLLPAKSPKTPRLYKGEFSSTDGNALMSIQKCGWMVTTMPEALLKNYWQLYCLFL